MAEVGPPPEDAGAILRGLEPPQELEQCLRARSFVARGLLAELATRRIEAPETQRLVRPLARVRAPMAEVGSIDPQGA